MPYSFLLNDVADKLAVGENEWLLEVWDIASPKQFLLVTVELIYESASLPSIHNRHVKVHQDEIKHWFGCLGQFDCLEPILGSLCSDPKIL